MEEETSRLHGAMDSGCKTWSPIKLPMTEKPRLVVNPPAVPELRPCLRGDETYLIPLADIDDEVR